MTFKQYIANDGAIKVSHVYLEPEDFIYHSPVYENGAIEYYVEIEISKTRFKYYKLRGITRLFCCIGDFHSDNHEIGHASVFILLAIPY